MTRRPTRAVTAALLIPLALTSCGGGEGKEKAAPSSTTSKAAPTSSAPKASPVSKPSSSSSAAGKGLMDPSPKGAVNLARTYYATVNSTGKKPQPGVLDALALPSCKTCAGLEAEVRNLATNDQHYDRDGFAVKNAKILGTGDVLEVHSDVQQQTLRVVEADGSTVETVPGKAWKFVLFAKWTKHGWRVQEIQHAK